MSSIIRYLEQRIQYGSINLHMPDGQVHQLGNGPPYVDWHVHGSLTLPRIILDPERQLGHTYVRGEWDVGSGQLSRLVSVLMRNFPRPMPNRWRSALHIVGRRIAQCQALWRGHDRSFPRHDVSEWFYRQFLDQDLHYGCAYFIEPDVSLEEAQRAKCRHIAGKLHLRPGQRVLDIGCGWGSLALYLARHTGVHVTGLDLARDRVRSAQRRATEAGLEERVEFRVQDYRSHQGRYDRIVSTDGFEHLGQGHYAEYFAHLRRLLQDDGVALLHTVGRYGPPGSTNPWIRKHIFPGGYSPSLSETAAAIEHSGLISADVEVLRLHYARTLAAWQERFRKNRSRIAQRMGRKFCRMWEFYLATAENAFHWRDLVVYQIQMVRRHQALPLTRHYLYPVQEEFAFDTPYPVPGGTGIGQPGDNL